MRIDTPSLVYLTYLNDTLYLQILIEQGGIEPGGLNFDAKIRRESTNLTDLFIAHIGLQISRTIAFK